MFAQVILGIRVQRTFIVKEKNINCNEYIVENKKPVRFFFGKTKTMAATSPRKNREY
jgi:hypothetical protein